MAIQTLIKEKLRGRYENFIKYCEETNKTFIEQLNGEDFRAYSAKYSVPQDQVEQLKDALNFKEIPASEKVILPEKKSFQDFPLRKIFKIDTTAGRGDIPITDIDFSGRVQNLLKKINIMTLNDLADMSLTELTNAPGFGKNSVDNVIATLKKFAESKKKKISVKTFNRAKEDLDEFLRKAALKHDPQIDPIIAAFENFSATWNKNVSLPDPLVRKIRALPAAFKNKKIHLFLPLYDFKHKEIFDELPDDFTLSVLPKWLAENNITFDEDELINFVDTLNINLQAFAKKIVSVPLKNRREIEIVQRRAKKITLEEIGKIFGITRERVRQIELESIDKFTKVHSDARKFFYILHALTDGRVILTLDDIKKFVNETDAELIWFFAVKSKLDSDIFSYDKDRSAFVFYDGADFDEAELLKDLPSVMGEKIFNETIEALAHEKNCPVEVMMNRISKFYERSGKVFHREKLTLTFKCGYLLKECFPLGYKIADNFFYSRFNYYLKEVFNEKNTSTQRNVDATIGRIGVLCNRGKYIHPDFVNVPPEIMERVREFIENSKRNAIFYKEIFTSLKKLFVGTQITNHYFLQGVIRFYKFPYILRKDYLTKVDEISISKEFNRFVEEQGEVSSKEIREKFTSFGSSNKTFLLERCSDVVGIGGGRFLHASRLNLKEEDFEPIKNFLNETCATPMHSRLLFDSFSERFADFMTRNEISNHNKLFGILRYMFRDEFNFSRPYISIQDVKFLTIRKILLDILKGTDSIEIKDFVNVCSGQGMDCRHKTYFLEILRPDFIRVDEFTLKRPDSIGVTDEVISAVTEKICAAMEQNGGWQTAAAFKDYDSLPQLNVSWNSFLLEGVATLDEDSFYQLKVPRMSTNLSTMIFISEEFAEDDFKTFMHKILTAAHKEKPLNSQDEIFNWLKEKGLCDKKLPKFLEEDDTFLS